jgi:mevalonate pyrophosphate decarboxylase
MHKFLSVIEVSEDEFEQMQLILEGKESKNEDIQKMDEVIGKKWRYF